jgi:hypothetical protein
MISDSEQYLASYRQNKSYNFSERLLRTEQIYKLYYHGHKTLLLFPENSLNFKKFKHNVIIRSLNLLHVPKPGEF